MKKILVIAHYFYPDVASTGQILTDLCEKLTDKFEVTVICTVPSYTGRIEKRYKEKNFYYEKYKNINIIRVRVSEFDKKNKISRIKNILNYFFGALRAIKLSGKQDVIYTISQPPILGGILGVLAKKIKKAKLIYNIQDFNPEQVMAVNYSKNKFILKVMMFLDKSSCKKSDLIITVGRDMQENLNKRFNNQNVPNNIVINNWIDDESVYPIDKKDKEIIKFKEKYGLLNKFVIMYSGNIGLYYDLENIVKIMAKFDDDDVVFTFVGSGAVKEKLEEYVRQKKLKNFVFIPYQDKEKLVYSLNCADLHLVTNAKGIKGVSVPSKIYGIMATNIPCLGILEKESEAWKIIEESKCGLLCETGNYIDIEQKLKEITVGKTNYVKKYQKGRKYVVDNFSKNKSIKMYIEAINDIVK